MRIKDVIIKEAAPAKVPPQPTLGGKPSTGPKGQAWLKKYGATHNPDGTPKAASAQPVNNTSSAYAPTISDRAADPNVAGVAKATDATSLRAAQDAAAGNAAPVAASGAEGDGASPGAAAALANMGKPAQAPAAPADDLARMTQLAGAGNPAGGGYGNFTGNVPQNQAAQAAPEPAPAPVAAPAPAPVAAEPAAQPAPQVNPDTGLNAAPKPVTTGTGGKTNIVTGSDDEMAWRAKNPQWNMTGAQYPGAGNWDPKTGRSKVAQAQADANAAAVKGFFNKINPFAKKEAPAAAPAPGQAAQAAPPAPGAAGAMAAMREADDALLATIRGIR